MSRPDPKVGTDAPATEPADEADDDTSSRVASLVMLGDADGLVALAKELRAGTAERPRDLAGCLRAYEAAAELGHVVAAHAVGLFYLNGTVAPRDEERAALAFRKAADAGHLPSKVMIANFYELGIFYRKDAQKADVWYRTVARAAEIDAAEGTPEQVRRLADLGCVRHCEALVAEVATSDADRTRYQKLLRIHGGAGAGRPSALPEMLAESTPVPGTAPGVRGAAPSAAPDAAPGAPKPTPKDESRVPRVKVTAALGLTAFVYATIFVTIGVVLGHVGDAFAREHVGAGGALPLLGDRAELVLPLAVALLGALPSWLVYKTSAFLRALALAFVFGVAAEILWGMGKTFLPGHVMQVTDAATAGLALGLLVFGVFGGAHAGSK